MATKGHCQTQRSTAGLPDGSAPPVCRSADGCTAVPDAWSSDITMALSGLLHADSI